MSSSRASLDSESGYSVVDHSNDGHQRRPSEVIARNSQLAKSYGTSSDGRLNSYSISSIMSTPSTSTAAVLSTNLSNLNPLRSTTGPKTGATRGKAATPIVLSELPKVSRKDFDAYIESIRPDYTTWSKLQSALADRPLLEEIDADESLDEEASRRKKAVAQALEGSNLGQGKKGRRRTQLPSLDEIPQIFFEENFNLANPHTFEVVTTGSTGGTEGNRQQSLSDFSTDQILQEKLSHYLDIVEVHLSVEISMRSASFFSALSNLQALDSQSAEALKEIASLKTVLTEVDTSVAQKGLDAVRKGAKRRKLSELDQAVERVKEVLRAVEQAEDMGEAGEIDGALDLIEALENEWDASLQDETNHPLDKTPLPPSANETPRPLAVIGEDDESEVSTQHTNQPKTPLTSIFRRSQHHAPVRIARIHALSGVPSRLSSLRLAIAQALEHELLAVLLHERGEALSDFPIVSSSASTDADKEKTEVWQDRVKTSMEAKTSNILEGLVRCGKPAVDSALIAWRDSSLRNLRRTLQDRLPQAAVDAHDEDDAHSGVESSGRSSFDGVRPPADTPSSTATTLPGMSHAAFMELTRNIYTAMLGCISVTDIQSQVIYQVVSRSLKSPPSDSESTVSSGAALNEAWTTALQAELTETIQAVADLANARLAKLVTNRAEVHAQLPLRDFVEIFEDTWQFVLKCETLGRKMIVGLRGVILAQSKTFLQTFHQRQLTAAAKAIETEQWSPADVSSSVQGVVSRLVDSAMQDPPQLNLKNQSRQSDKVLSGSVKHLSIEDKEFFAVSAGLRSLEALEEYLTIVINLPQLTTDVMSKIIEFLKQFNSRTCQVVLGAGAMRSAGLKNITAKHLALASQALSIMISLIPYIRECLRRHLRAKQAVILVDFDKLRRDYQEHQYEIHAKLVAIMGDRLSVHCKTLQSIDWEKESDSAPPNAYMETLVKEAGTLHKVLLKYLPGSALEMVMMQVLSAINSRLADEYGRIELKSESAKERILADAKYMRVKFSELKGLERPTPGAELESLIQMKRVIASAPAPPVKSFTTPSLTRTQTGSVSQHKRTPSSSSLVRPETPAKEVEKPPPTPEKEVPPSAPNADSSTPVDMAQASQQAEPVDVATDLQPAAVQGTSEIDAVKPEVEIEAGVPGPLLPQEIPLPLSPTLAAADPEATVPSDEQPPMDPLPPAAPECTASPLLTEAPVSTLVERRPSASERLLNLVNPSTPAKSSNPPAKPEGNATPSLPGPTPPKATSPPPAGNVTNRLAGLFSKRPTASLPKVSIPSLPSIIKPHQTAITSPSRGTGSPIQAKDSLDLARSPVKRGASSLALPETGHVVSGSSDVSTEDLPASLEEADQQVNADVSVDVDAAKAEPGEEVNEVDTSVRDVRHSLDSVD